MIALMCAALLCMERTEEQLSHDYEVYAGLCAIETEAAVAEMKRIMADTRNKIKQAGRARIVPGSTDAYDKQGRMQFASRAIRDAYIKEGMEAIKIGEEAIRKSKGKSFAAAPLEIPFQLGDIGSLAKYKATVWYINDDGTALLKIGGDVFLYKGDCKGLARFQETDLGGLVLHATGTEVREMPAGNKKEVVIVQEVDLIGLRHYLQKLLPEFKEDKHDIGARPNAK